jgi:hypothetical protein
MLNLLCESLSLLCESVSLLCELQWRLRSDVIQQAGPYAKSFTNTMVFISTFNSISVILWRSVLLVEETGVHGENHDL